MKKLSLILLVSMSIGLVVVGCSNASSGGNGGSGGNPAAQGTWKNIPAVNNEFVLKITGANFELSHYVSSVLNSGYRGTYVISGNNISTTTNSVYNGSAWVTISTETHNGTISISGNTLTMSHPMIDSNASLIYIKQ